MITYGDDGRIARPLLAAMRRGFGMRCPRCGHGRLFRAFLKVADVCGNCGLDLTHQQADDAPPYFTVLIIGHTVIPLCLVAEQLWHPPMWLQMTFWLPTAVLLIGLLLPRIKGAIVGLQWSQRMHGFGEAG